MESDKDTTSSDLSKVEQEILATVQAKLDQRALIEVLSDTDVEDDDLVPSSFQIAATAATVTSTASFLLTHNVLLTIASGLLAFIAANSDPLDDDIAGPVARMLGRSTLHSVEATRPKLKAVARAALTGEEEIAVLRERVRELQSENDELQLWKDRRILVEELLPSYSQGQLKTLARKNGLTISGTKTQLLMRLLEADVIGA